MNYTNQYFGKDITTLTYQDVEDYFVQPKDESDKIEYKSYYSPEEKNHTEKENGVLRAICGLLNSEGGLVIWGAPTGVNIQGRKEKVFQGQLSPSKTLVEKDSFIRRIADLITPSPKGVKFQMLERNGDYVYVIEVDPSSYAPHQFRNIYYMRIDGQTKPAPHHYVEALFRKVNFPKLEGYIKIESVKSDGRYYHLEVTNMIFNLSKLQNEHEIYYRIVITLGTFANYGSFSGKDKIYTMKGHDLRSHNAKSTLYYGEVLSNTETIVIDPYKLVQGNEMQIWFYFGGKQSPLMLSKYKLIITDLYETNLNNFFTSIEENRYSYELSEEIKKTEAEKLKFILGR